MPFIQTYLVHQILNFNAEWSEDLPPNFKDFGCSILVQAESEEEALCKSYAYVLYKHTERESEDSFHPVLECCPEYIFNSLELLYESEVGQTFLSEKEGYKYKIYQNTETSFIYFKEAIRLNETTLRKIKDIGFDLVT